MQTASLHCFMGSLAVITLYACKTSCTFTADFIVSPSQTFFFLNSCRNRPRSHDTAQYCESHSELVRAPVPLQGFSEIPLNTPANIAVYLIWFNHSLDHFPERVQIAAINRATALLAFHYERMQVTHRQKGLAMALVFSGSPKSQE